MSQLGDRETFLVGRAKVALVCSRTHPGRCGAAQDLGHPPIQAEVADFLPWECRERLGKSPLSISMIGGGCFLRNCFRFQFFFHYIR